MNKQRGFSIVELMYVLGGMFGFWAGIDLLFGDRTFAAWAASALAKLASLL